MTLEKPRQCNGTGTCSPGTTQSCAPYTCSNATCLTSCTTSAQCAPGFACSNGSCTTACTSDAQCGSTAYCNGTICVAKLLLGSACTATNQCASGFCVSGVCCDNACTTTCTACTAALKGSGSDGTCGPVASGTDPLGQCADQGATSCGTTGMCNGAGACAKYAAGTVCVAASCAGTILTSASYCNGTGTCASGSTTNCAPASCVGGACLTTCAVDTDCAAGSYCNGTQCAYKLTNGGACSANNECVSNYCVDGVCCGTACTGVCQACSAAKKGSGTDGTCGPVMNATDPDNECADQGAASCGTNGSCDGAGACQKYQTGTVCNPSSCAADGITRTAASTCNALGQCAAGTTSSCAPYLCVGGACTTGCTSDGQCAPNAYCNGTNCIGKKALGSGCSSDHECVSGSCADGVCCDLPCQGLCEACTTAKKGSGANGVCGAIADGMDPDNECANQGAASCGTDGACNGSGACRLYATSTICVAASCTGTTATATKTCDGLGNCSVGGGTTSCLPYACSATACYTSCTSAAQCAAGYYCSGAQCVAKLADGVSCTASNQCTSGNCVDGVCCDTACGGVCQACTAAKKGAGTDGACGPIGVGTDPDNECADQGAASCGTNGSCDGAGACQKYSASTQCVAQSCTGSTQTDAASCDGNGNCPTPSTTSCLPYVCSGASCLASCTTDADCTSGYYCGMTATCLAKKTTGTAGCGGDNECVSGFCADNYCCNTACNGPCQACDLTGNLGTCSATAQFSSDPLCPVGDQCNGSGSCANADGQTCASNADCASGACVDAHNGSTYTKICCHTACGNGLSCNDSTNTCYTSCGADTVCAQGYYCSNPGVSGTCVAKGAQGATCTAGNQCLTGNCVDGVCCGSASCPTCQTCNGATPGTCTGIATNSQDTNPAGACDATTTPAKVCSAGGCLVASGGTCSVNRECSTNRCSSSTCAAACTNNGDCASNYTCNTTFGVCLGDNTKTCTIAAQCQSNYCTAGECDACTTGSCPSGHTCNSGVCKGSAGKPCYVDTHCSSGSCNGSGFCN